MNLKRNKNLNFFFFFFFFNFFLSYRIVARGSYSVIERRQDKVCFELFGSKEISLSTLFWFGRFDEAMIAFLHSLSEFCEFIRKQDRHFAVPYP